MAWTIPNFGSTIEYPIGSSIYPQAQPDEVDWQILRDGHAGQGVSSGCAVTQRGAGANQSVDVASGTVVIGAVEIVVTTGNLAATAAHASLPRFDLVTINNAGTKVYTAGTASATPVFPAIPANSVVLASVFRQPNDNVISNAEIVDKRFTVASPTAAAGWTTVEKSGDTARSSTTTETDDPDLLFAMVANGEYRIRGRVWIETAGATPDFKYSLTGPASPTLVRIHRRIGNGGGAVADVTGSDIAYVSAATIVSTVAMTGAVLEFEAIVFNGANAGNFKLTWAQNTSDAAATTVKAGSYVEYARVD